MRIHRHHMRYRVTADSPLTAIQQRFVDAYLANKGDLKAVVESVGCKMVSARHWLNTHPAIRARLNVKTPTLVVNPMDRREALLRLRTIARRPAREKINYSSQIAAIELAARIEGWIHEPAPSQTQVNVKVGESTADASKYAALANRAAELVGDAMPALPEGDDPQPEDGDGSTLPVG
jgi:hypothetical protein